MFSLNYVDYLKSDSFLKYNPGVYDQITKKSYYFRRMGITNFSKLHCFLVHIPDTIGPSCMKDHLLLKGIETPIIWCTFHLDVSCGLHLHFLFESILHYYKAKSGPIFITSFANVNLEWNLNFDIEDEEGMCIDFYNVLESCKKSQTYKEGLQNPSWEAD